MREDSINCSQSRVTSPQEVASVAWILGIVCSSFSSAIFQKAEGAGCKERAAVAAAGLHESCASHLLCEYPTVSTSTDTGLHESCASHLPCEYPTVSSCTSLRLCESSSVQVLPMRVPHCF
ncbi:hypothetical protein O6H91_08G074600 [Diphasiastrum complanatum]|uniref:Uncharacterized protein n=1 Tax=Diphasiastrum complanatum TaxID=34168 RepID=A0ACC2CYY9_DIPCM|nr:hypothetical protein O6H91_08G074600 [Diphasiastrum complanatum]